MHIDTYASCFSTNYFEIDGVEFMRISQPDSRKLIAAEVSGRSQERQRKIESEKEKEKEDEREKRKKKEQARR